MAGETAGFELIDHTADVGVVATGRDLKEVFANAARGMFSIIAELEGIEERVSREVEVTSDDLESLLIEWLNELLFIFDVEHILFGRFEILELEDRRLRARVHGEKVDLRRHELKTGIKAATYHMLKIEKDDVFRAKVIFDV